MQEDTIAELVGSSSLAGEYIDPDQNVYLARGHLSPNSDFVYKSFQVQSCPFMVYSLNTLKKDFIF